VQLGLRDDLFALRLPVSGSGAALLLGAAARVPAERSGEGQGRGQRGPRCRVHTAALQRLRHGVRPPHCLAPPVKEFLVFGLVRLRFGPVDYRWACSGGAPAVVLLEAPGLFLPGPFFDAALAYIRHASGLFTSAQLRERVARHVVERMHLLPALQVWLAGPTPQSRPVRLRLGPRCYVAMHSSPASPDPHSASPATARACGRDCGSAQEEESDPAPIVARLLLAPLEPDSRTGVQAVLGNCAFRGLHVAFSYQRRTAFFWKAT
jgi:hypothetical protein